ncbi:hypothetical protein IG631_16092 [Alternaria alternata]|nr:hypothetical protein IG631_16092 [Alternaria alternata]
MGLALGLVAGSKWRSRARVSSDACSWVQVKWSRGNKRRTRLSRSLKFASHLASLNHYSHRLNRDLTSFSSKTIATEFNRSKQTQHNRQHARLHLRLRCCFRRCIGSGTFSSINSHTIPNGPLTFIQDSSSAPSSSIDPAPQTTYLTQTNSLGVVTGMPAADTSIATQPDAVTSQPAAVTTQPVPADIPAVGPGVHTLTLAGTGTGSMVNSTRTVTVSANNSTTVALVASPTNSDADATGSGASRSGADATGSDASGTATGSGAGADATGAAVNVKAAAGSLVGFGAFMAAFL